MVKQWGVIFVSSSSRKLHHSGALLYFEIYPTQVKNTWKYLQENLAISNSFFTMSSYILFLYKTHSRIRTRLQLDQTNDLWSEHDPARLAAAFFPCLPLSQKDTLGHEHLYPLLNLYLTPSKPIVMKIWVHKTNKRGDINENQPLHSGTLTLRHSQMRSNLQPIQIRHDTTTFHNKLQESCKKVHMSSHVHLPESASFQTCCF